MPALIGRLLLEIDEAWLDHAERIRPYPAVSEFDVALEELLFAAAEWLRAPPIN
jgi:hypothetical protein